MKLSLDYTVARLANSNRVDLGDGFYFEGITRKVLKNPTEKSLVLELRKEGVDGIIGYLSTYIYPEIGPAISGIMVNEGWRGQYMGEKMVKGFVQLYGSLASNPEGMTSYEAGRVWERLGADKIPTDKTALGFIFILRR